MTKHKKTILGVSVKLCPGGLNMIRREDFGTTLVFFKRKKPIYGFRIKLKIVPGRFHEDPIKNAEAHEIIKKTDIFYG